MNYISTEYRRLSPNCLLEVKSQITCTFLTFNQDTADMLTTRHPKKVSPPVSTSFTLQGWTTLSCSSNMIFLLPNMSTHLHSPHYSVSYGHLITVEGPTTSDLPNIRTQLQTRLFRGFYALFSCKCVELQTSYKSLEALIVSTSLKRQRWERKYYFIWRAAQKHEKTNGSNSKYLGRRCRMWRKLLVLGSLTSPCSPILQRIQCHRCAQLQF